MPKYFTGRNVTSKKLVSASASIFQDFVAHYINLPVPISITGDEYRGLPTKADRDEIKRQAGYFVPCTFPSSPWLGRLLEHACECNLIALDIDVLPDGGCPAAPFVNDPSALKKVLSKFNFAAYKTISSTPELPRLRIVVEASAIPVDQYADAVLTVAQIIGLSHVTRESAIPVQAMFRPTVFSDTDTDTDHPLIITSYEGRSFNESDISDDLESLPGMVGGTKKPAVPRKTGGVDVIEDYLLHFSRPLPQITVAVARDALEAVSPDLGYAEWFEIAAALRHQFTGGWDEDEAYEVFDTWSAKGSKYAGADDTAAKWKSLAQQPVGRAPITIRTLLKHAVEGGWDSGEVKDDCFQSLSNWINFECKSGPRMMADASKKIAATPLISNTEMEALIQMVVSSLRQRFEMRVPAGAFRKEIKQHRESLQNQSKDEQKETPVPPWARGIVYVSTTDEFFRPSTRQPYKVVPFDRTYGRKLLPTVKDLQAAESEVNQGTLHRPMYLPSEYLLNHLKCQTVFDFDYDPSSPQDIILKRDGKLFVNIYRRSYQQSDKALASYAEDVFCEHIINLIKEPEYRTIVMDWMAHNIQFPGIKIRWALLMQGAEGCGKTFLAECMRSMVGNDNLKLVSSGSIKKGWSEWVFGSQIVAFEEIRVAGQNRHDLMNTLKEPISNDFVSMLRRGCDDRNIRNVTNYIAFTNHHDALVLSEESRRWMVLKSRMQKKQQIDDMKAKRPGYFVWLFDMLKTHGPGLRYWFENRTISDDFAVNGPAPHTKYLSEMIFDTSSELLATLHKIWEEGENPFVQTDIIGSSSLTEAFKMEALHTVTEQQIAHLLRDGGFTKLDGRHTVEGKCQYYWVRSDVAFDGNPLDILATRIKEKTSDIWD